MSNDLMTMNEGQKEKLVSVLQSSIYPNAKPESVMMVLSYCQAAKLDPIQKPVHIVPMWDSKTKSMRDVIMPGIGLYRIIAARSGCAGIDEPEFGEDVTQKIGGVEVTYPMWCKVTVKRQLESGEVAEFTAKEFWLENYATRGGQDKSIAPNSMWQKRPYGQLAKCAEAQALRKAFPEVGAQPTAEEMEGKVFDKEIEYKPAVEVVEQKPKLSPARFTDAIKAIKAGTYTDAELIKRFDLTEEQKEMLDQAVVDMARNNQPPIEQEAALSQAEAERGESE